MAGDLPGPEHLERIFGGLLSETRGRASAADQAQNLMYQAWEAPARSRRVRLAKDALALWPDCADAYLLLADDTARNAGEAIHLYELGVAADERILGKRAFKEDVGHFWGILETRPYMRARGQLAMTLESVGRISEAIEHYRDMLRLNPNDNQGIRYSLLRALLTDGRDAEAAAFLAQSDDAMAAWLYPRALVAFRRSGAGAKADALLRKAIHGNAFVPDYLLGVVRTPQRLPDYIGFGDRNEAMAYAAENLPLWQATPGALAWLKEVRNRAKRQ